jgi:hypothetical protein
MSPDVRSMRPCGLLLFTAPLALAAAGVGPALPVVVLITLIHRLQGASP